MENPWIIERVIPALKASSKVEVLQELAEAAARELPGVEVETLLQVLREREKIGTTAKGHGVAIPHGKVAGLDRLELFFARSADGIAFDAPDSKPVHFFFVMLAPERKPTPYPVWLGRLARVAKKHAIRTRLMAAAGPRELLAILKEI